MMGALPLTSIFGKLGKTNEVQGAPKLPEEPVDVMAFDLRVWSSAGVAFVWKAF